MDRVQKVHTIGKFYGQVHEVHIQFSRVWLNQTLFHWDWWLSFALAILPWVIWFRLRKRESTFRLMWVGVYVLTVTSWFDFIGVCMGKWYYTGKLVPTIPSYIPFDFCIFPVTVMLMIQYKTNVSPWIKAILFGGFSAFIAEPLFSWLQFYVIVQWRYIYSLPIYVLIYLTADWASKRKSFALIS